MGYTLRYIKISMVASIALLFSLVTFNNITDFLTNWEFVKHVLSMDTTSRHASMWRAITYPEMQLAAYYFIILWEALTGSICWIGCIIMLVHVQSQAFNFSKKIAYMGLFMGFLLYMVGFIIIAGEWFNMWQSPQWNGQSSASIFLSIILFVFLILHQPDNANSEK